MLLMLRPSRSSHLTISGLRHTHATVLLEAGENPKVVQERLGHTTFTTTMDIYSNARELHQTGENRLVA